MFAEDFQPYKEETMKEIHIHKIGFNGDKAKLVLCNDYEFETEGKEVYVVKKQPQYPKTYDECCNMYGADCATYSLETFKALRELIYCRNSYWKIAGDWKPDFHQINQHRYYISSIPSFLEELLPFPTEEVRDAFYKNFKDLIEQCKELLL